MDTSSIPSSWWKEAVVYQIYPASFRDTNGDGWGDILGIISKLDYLGRVDMGYDISDYKAIDLLYGSLEEVDRLIAELAKRGMKLMLDLVVNHTSDQHPWFLESRSSTTNLSRDFYIWKKPRYDANGNRQPPNDWAMILGGSEVSAWSWDEASREYYLSLFTPEQPDLNWDNPKVREAIYDILDSWLARGVCGFRMDVINLNSKDPLFPDARISTPSTYQAAMSFMPMAVTVGELPHITDENEILRTVGTNTGELNMIFIFDMVDIDGSPTGDAKTIYPWKVSTLRKIINKWQKVMIDRDGWNAIFCENHDTPRSLTRLCDDSDQYRELGAKLLCLLFATLSGTLFIFQGQELGMRNIPAEWDIAEYKDIGSSNYWKKINELHEDNPLKLAEARKILQRKARDNTRTPLPWNSSSPNAGFCEPSTRPWMRLNDDFPTVNVEAQTTPLSFSSKPSVFAFWTSILKFRKDHKEALVYGDFELIGALDADNDIIAYKRFSEAETIVVLINLSGQLLEWQVPETLTISHWEFGNYPVWAEGE